MFDNVGGKLKGLAKFVCFVGIIASVICGIIILSNNYRGEATGIGLAVLLGGSLLSWIGSWSLYAFGQITEDIHAMRGASDMNTCAPKYKKASELLRQRKYDEAAALFEELVSYNDSSDKAKECYYQKAMDFFQSEKYSDAINTFTSIETYRDSAEKIKEAWYKAGQLLLKAKNYDSAYSAFENADDYQDASKMLIEISYLQGKEYLASRDYKAAYEYLSYIRDYKDAENIIQTNEELKKLDEESGTNDSKE